ncbi:haloacid dehalogenase [Verrucomicrobia bacterium SCGC AG-212-E04]|nr:haloacid dehalogenase [Verrucomicrobia bacterium SCGC AG-212-E04]
MYDLIAFDADDTLWHNERLYLAMERQFRELLSPYHSVEWIGERLNATEAKNLRHFGYGVKGFVLSMIETAIELTEGRITGVEIQSILSFGREMLRAPIELLDGVRETVEELARSRRLVLVTKGDLFDQENKLARSGLGHCFSAVEIVTEKTPMTYRTLLARHGVEAGRFLMIGNSLRSDILPVLEVGGMAIHIPYETTWVHDRVPDEELLGKDFVRLAGIRELTGWLDGRDGAAARS